MKKNVIKKQKGITLLALIITIIVLVILAGVAINTLYGNNNIIKNANKAVGKYNEKEDEEQIVSDTLEEKLREYINGGSSNPSTPEAPDTPIVDSNGLATKNETIKPDEKNNPNLQIVIPAGFAPAILQTGTTQSLPGQDGNVKEIMPAEKWNSITTEDINKGIVIVDEDGNEFVWVPIEDLNKFSRVAWTTKYGYDASGTWQQGNCVTPHPLANTLTIHKWWEDTNTGEYKNMITSVNVNKGFYVARYEASVNNDLTTYQSKREKNVWTDISQTDAITKSANYNSTLHSHLMYGIEWDSLLNWLNGNAIISSSTSGKNKIMDTSDLQTNSSSWGNYSNSIGDAATDSGVQQTTGASEYWKANNIYDIAGNAMEWTQEKWSTSNQNAVRGRYFYDLGDGGPVAYRYCIKVSETSEKIGFRASFYL